MIPIQCGMLTSACRLLLLPMKRFERETSRDGSGILLINPMVDSPHIVHHFRFPNNSPNNPKVLPTLKLQWVTVFVFSIVGRP